MYGYIYKFTLEPTGLIYVGKRVSEKFDESYWGSGIAWAIAINEYKNTPKHKLIQREILEWATSKEELDSLEQKWIEKLNSRNKDIGYNIAAGGQGGGVADCYWFNDGEKEFYVYKDNLEFISDNWVKGRLFNHSVNKDHIWVNNGIEQTHCLIDNAMDYINSGWEFGMLYRGDEWAINATDHFRTEEAAIKRNEKIRKFHKEHPEFRNDGMFKKGQAPKNKGMKWATNGIINKYFHLDSELPEGWKWGCTVKRKKRGCN